MPVIDSELATALATRHPGASVEGVLGQPLCRVIVRDGAGRAIRYLVRSIAAEPERADELDRAMRIVQNGVLHSLPEGVESGNLQIVTTTGGDRLLLSLDLPRASDHRLDAQAAHAVLVALARVHAAFAGFPARLTSGLGLLPLGQWLANYRPGPNAAAPVNAGWQAFAARLPDAWTVVAPLLDAPAPLVDALRDCQPTIVLGNPVPAELSIGDDTVTFHDWGQATRGPGALDLGMFVGAAWPVRDLSIAGCVEDYRVERARLGRLPASGERWEREIALGLLAGVLRHGWAIAGRPETIDEWGAIVAAGHDALA